MAKEEMLEFPGLVKELLPNATFRVELENGHDIFSGHLFLRPAFFCLPFSLTSKILVSLGLPTVCFFGRGF